ncbi:bifunctional glutamate N-acetyltransferase/amino-acid acetyltransferase ArgJ [Ruminococcaceae bacterium OttesenSCG-928-I18]|nr:bifunctional glutamate N-acetyltransferase/amino-acid acetyltransferase ArgJ [Ruminococcaceae bacterium OttesenSCG-928-I18]
MKYKKIPGGICAAEGFMASGAHCGIRNNTSKPDIALIVSSVACHAAAVYTQNKVKGAPIHLTQKHLADGKAKAILCNSGNANTCNPDGPAIAQTCCNLAAEATGLRPEDFIIASTGVIGQPLSTAPFEKGLPKLAAALRREGSTDAADAILTTDTKHKEFAYEFSLGGKTCHIGAIGKGSGMINPNMATMLVFLTTDVAIGSDLLEQALQAEILHSFNQLYIDGDTSTNDMVSILASGLAGNQPIEETSGEYQTFREVLHTICVKMCRALAADGEGATKLLECHVNGAPSGEIARRVAKTVVSSDLCKTAMFGEDANWGRVLCAIGYTEGDFPVDKVSLILKSSAGEVLVCENATHRPFSEEEASRILAEDELQLLIDLQSGTESGTAWGCDLTYDYVKINGDYRT